MPWASLPVLFLFVAAGICAGLFWQSLVHYRRDALQEGKAERLTFALRVFLGSVTLWLLAYAAELLSPTLGQKILASKVQYLGVTIAPTAWLVYIVHYVGMGQLLTSSKRRLLLLEPGLITIAVWSNEFHGLIWRRFATVAIAPTLSLAQIQYGALFYLHVGYSYVILMMATVLLLRTLRRSQTMYRNQSLILLVAAIAPWVGNLLYLLKPTGWIPLDWTPFGFLVTGIAAVWGQWRFRLWDVLPIARDAVLENMHDSVMVMDLENRLLDLNPAAQRLLGLHPQRGFGQSVSHLLQDWTALHPLLASDASQSISLVCQKPAQQWFEVNLSPLLNPRQQPIGRLMVFHDVTDQQEAEQALLKARNVAEQASQAKSRFLATMSHELRTPLNAIIGYSELLKEECQGMGQPRFIEDLDIIRSAGNHLLTLINNILDFSKLEAGKMSLFIEFIDIAALVQEISQTIEPLVLQNNNQFEVCCEPNLGMMESDILKVRQILFNLLSNAAKFTRDGQVSLLVRRKTKGKDLIDNWVEFQVVDTGLGMSPEQVERIFNAFEQAEASTAKRYGGTGLGLAISQAFAEMLGGSITVRSWMGKGSTFSVLLPLQCPLPQRDI
jgi:PAS domain S-box-containing protein